MADDQTGTSAAGAAEDSFQQMYDRARELNEQIVQAASAAGEEMLNRYVGWLENVAEEQRKFAASPRAGQMDWLAAMLNAQADFTRKLADSVREFSARSTGSTS